jgi:thiamine kinase-like enzyme
MEKGISNLIRDQFGNFDYSILSGGFTNEVFKIEIENGQQYVTKIINSIYESSVNKILSNHGFDHKPKLISTLDLEDRYIMIFNFIESFNLYEKMNEMSDTELSNSFKNFGELVGLMHNLQIGIEEQLQLNPLPELSNKGLDFIPEELNNTTTQYLISFNKFLDSRKSTLIHGDLGPQQVVIDESTKTYLLDFETACFANPGYDIGWCFWIVNYHLDVDKHKIAFDSFIKGYSQNRKWDYSSDEIRYFAVRKIFEVLPRFKTEPKSTKEEWEKRLEIALEWKVIS